MRNIYYLYPFYDSLKKNILYDNLWINETFKTQFTFYFSKNYYSYYFVASLFFFGSRRHARVTRAVEPFARAVDQPQRASYDSRTVNVHTRFLLALVLLIALLATGVIGFSIIEGWSLVESIYMTLITITTVGFQEVHPLSPTGRYFMIVFLVFSIASVGYALSTVAAYIFEGQIVSSMRHRRMERYVKKLKDHFIICGLGDIGREVAREFSRSKQPFVVIEKDPDRPGHLQDLDVPFVHGDAEDENVLEQAGIHQARGLVAALPNEADNVYVVLTARQMNNKLTIVAKAGEESTGHKLRKAGADRVVTPSQIAGRRMAATMLRPTVVNFLDVVVAGGDVTLRLEEFRIGPESPVVGHTLRELNIGQHTGAIVLSILGPGGASRCTPTGALNVSTLTLDAHDTLIALGSEEQLEQLAHFVKRGPPAQTPSEAPSS